MATTLEQIESIISLSASLDNGQMDDVYSALATRIAGQGAKDLAEAITELQTAGVDPDKFIPVSRSYARHRREELKLRIEEQKLRHAEEMHQVQLRKSSAGAKVIEAQADKLSKPKPTAPAQPQPQP